MKMTVGKFTGLAEEYLAVSELQVTIAALQAENDHLRIQKAALYRERNALRAVKDAAYRERNQVVAALAKLFPAGIARTNIEGWDPEWHGCVFIDLPTGQASWHFHDDDAELFAGLPPYEKLWDGHTTPEKYERLAALESSSR